MKSLLTRLTENIGEEIANNINNNILNEDVQLSDFDPNDLQKILKKNPTLWKQVQDELKKSKPKKVSRSSSSHSSSDWSDVGCGRSSRSSCGGSYRSSSYSDYGCGRSGRSSGC